MKQYLYVAVAGRRELQRWVEAESEKEAKKIFWNGLDSDFRDVVENTECIDEREIQHPIFKRRRR